VLMAWNTVLTTAGLVFALTSMMAWLMLFRAHPRLPSTLWTLGGLFVGIGFMLYADRVDEPRLPKYLLANVLQLGALILRAQALRIDLRRPRASPGGLLLVALPLLLVPILGWWSNDSLYLVYANAVGVGYGIWLVSLAWKVGQAGPSRNGVLMALVEGLWIGAVVLRIVRHLVEWPHGLRIDTWDYAVFSVLTVVAGVYSNLAYVGMALDRSRAAATRAHEARAVEAAQREAAEHGAGELRAMLEQRDQLAAERNQLLQVLAHEIRQPLHNASGALHAATLALQTSREQGLGQAMQRVERAESVLAGVHSVLDNTLTATRLMDRSGPLTLQDVDLMLLVGLALGDLPPAERQRVQVQVEPGLHSAELEPGLVRLALRNLLRNAFMHGGPDTHVRLHITERDGPPALCLSVADTGRGLSAGMLSAEPLAVATARAPGASNRAPLTPRGLGLPLVRRVMALHAGRLELAAGTPHGLVASLVFPLPAAEPEPEPAA